jgi:glucan 1,3-beta-glucosidase
MMTKHLLLVFALSFAARVFAVASSYNTTHALSTTSNYWYENIYHNGLSPFAQNSSYVIFRNVKSYGAVGDGITDDSSAIQAAINDQGRGPGGNGAGTTGSPAVIYFPQGTYLMKGSIQLYVDTVLIGDPTNRPVLKAASSFPSSALVYAKDPAFDATINFYIAIKNLILDSTAVSASQAITLLDWSVSQATQLTNVMFNMPDYSQHTGIAMPENGSGTYMGNLQFVGGLVGINLANQQYSFKDISFTGCNTGILISHVFDLVAQGLTFQDCGTAINAYNAGSVSVIDSTAMNVGNVIEINNGGTSLVLDNVQVSNTGGTVIAGGTTILSESVPETWVYGEAYMNDTQHHEYGITYNYTRSPALVSSNGHFSTIAPPTYQNYSLNQVVNVKTVPGYPVAGDGITDDTINLNAIIGHYAGTGTLLYFPAGTYIVTDTLFIPRDSQIVGEAWSAISAKGSAFSNEFSPKPMVQIGNQGDVGSLQISDMLFTVAEVLPGCILLEVNLAGVNPGDVGIWNTHFRVGGAAGSSVETSCSDDSAPCKAAYLLLYLSPAASIYIEDMWGWTADHDLDADYPQHISTGRGALIEATKGTWLVGTAFEHNTLYQYNLYGAENVYIGMQQCETPYWQGAGSSVLAPEPWSVNTWIADPDYANCASGDANCRMAWFSLVQGGSDLHIYGSGFWSFFNNNGNCLGPNGSCQSNAVGLTNNPYPSNMYWYNLNTLGVLNMVVNMGVSVATASSNPGSWGGVIASYLTYANYTFPSNSITGAANNIAFYWGQDSAGNEQSLAYYCQNNIGDIFVIAFIDTFGYGGSIDLNVADHCSTTFPGSNLLSCPQIGQDIKTCQSLGKKVLVSLGGAAGNHGFSNDAQAQDFAGTLWNLFGGGYSSTRPFGDAIVDGFDLDIENNDPTGYVALVNELHNTYFPSGNKPYYISTAPQCVFPDASVGPVLANCHVDFALIQFYNNDCEIGSNFNWNTWQNYASTQSPNPNISLFLGLPGAVSAAGAGYTDPSTIQSVVASIKDNGNFAGIMVWDASEAYNNWVNGNTFASDLKNILS